MLLTVRFLWICAGLLVSGAEAPRLSAILERLDQVTERYSDQSLRFTCDEKVVTNGKGYRNTHRFRYLFVIDERGRHIERRAPARKPAQWLEHRQERSIRELVLTSAYSWVFMFERVRHNYVRYEIVGTGTRFGREAIGVRFEPAGEIIEDVNGWIGVAWVDAETFLPLAFEAWRPKEYAKRKEFEASLDRAAASTEKYRAEHLVRSVRVEFGEQLRGLRFPTLVALQQTRCVVSGRNGTSEYREKSVFSVDQTYTNCEFSEVETGETFH